VAPVGVLVKGRDAATNAASGTAYLDGGAATFKAGAGRLEGDRGMLDLQDGEALGSSIGQINGLLRLNFVTDAPN